MNRPWQIYTLKDPRTSEVRYVGVTHGRTRLAEHIFSVKRKRTRTTAWIKTLLNVQLKPVMETLETGSGDNWAERERFWIAEYRRQGVKLTNHTDGGEGTLGWNPDAEWRKAAGERTKLIHTGRKRSLETRKRQSDAQKRLAVLEREAGSIRGTFKRSPETLERMSKANLGKKLSAETRRKIGEATRNASPELRQQWAKAARNRPEKWLEWFAKNQKGITKSEEHKAKISVALKASWARRKAGS